jgi:hypothetical protein
MIRFPFLVLLVGFLVLAACSDDEPDRPVAVDYAPLNLSPSQLSFEEVQMRARGAIAQPGMITYVRELRAGDSWGPSDDLVEYEIWLDWEANSGRLDVRGFPDELVSAGVSSRYFLARQVPLELPETRPRDVLFEYFYDSPVDYLFALARDDLESVVISDAIHDGKSLIVVEAVKPGARFADGSFPDDRLRLVLNADFLPLSYETAHVSGTGDVLFGGAFETSTLQAAFLKRDSLDEGFFDERHVFGLDETPVERLQFAADTGVRAYWLGEAFENLRLKDVDGERDPNQFYQGHRFLRVDYALDHVDESAFPCDLRIFQADEFGPDRLTRLRLGVPPPKAPLVLEELDTSVGSVRIVKTFENVPIYGERATPSASNDEMSTIERLSLLNDRPIVGHTEDSSISAEVTTGDGVLVEVLLRCDRDDETTLRLLTAAVEELEAFDE